MTHHTRCPLCGEELMKNVNLKAYLGNYQLSIWECLECVLAFQRPQPTTQQSIDYMNWRYSSTDPQDVYITDGVEKLRISGERLRWLRGFKTPNKRILDAGAGSGAFISASLDAGYEALGFDFCPEAVALAKKMFNVDLILGSIDAIPNPSNYGVVTLWDVIEHVDNPAKMLLNAYTRMEKGGLLVLETCNWDSPHRREKGDAWSYYLYNHLYYFSQKSLKAILTRGGYVDIRFHRNRNRDILIATARRGE